MAEREAMTMGATKHHARSIALERRLARAPPGATATRLPAARAEREPRPQRQRTALARRVPSPAARSSRSSPIHCAHRRPRRLPAGPHTPAQSRAARPSPSRHAAGPPSPGLVPPALAPNREGRARVALGSALRGTVGAGRGASALGGDAGHGPAAGARACRACTRARCDGGSGPAAGGVATAAPAPVAPPRAGHRRARAGVDGRGAARVPPGLAPHGARARAARAGPAAGPGRGATAPGVVRRRARPGPGRARAAAGDPGTRGSSGRRGRRGTGARCAGPRGASSAAWRTAWRRRRACGTSVAGNGGAICGGAWALQ